jgi:type I restriction enzyme M protein
MRGGRVRAPEREFHHLTNYADTLVSFIWDVADLLRGPYRPPEYRKVMLPMTVLRRLDCVLEATKAKVLEEQKKLKGQNATLVDKMLRRAAKQQFYNTSKFDFAKLLADPEGLAQNLLHYTKAFSPETRALFDNFGFDQQIAKLDKSNRLFKLVQKFSEVDLHPNVVSNLDMGRSFEELVRKFNEAANEDAGDHFTPREVIRLMVDLIFEPDNNLLRQKCAVRTLFDPAAGTGGMLSEAAKYMRELNPEAKLVLFGQDFDPEGYAICGSDMLIKGEEIDNIRLGDSLGDGKTFDAFPGKKFDYMLANPPFGVKWESEEDYVRNEHDKQGYEGRFGAGLPRINDGSFLFLQHMISKMKPYSHADQTGSRIGIVFNGSPLFTGDAGSGESNIRKWIIENDWLEGIVALPDQLFYNTGINTYIWIVTNRKTRKRKGRVQLVNAVDLYSKMRKSLGNKRNELSDRQIEAITRIYGTFADSEHSKIFDNDDFGYSKIVVERPLRLSFSATQEHLAAFEASRAFEGIATSRKSGKEGKKEVERGQALQAEIRAALGTLPTDKVWMDREKFTAALDKVLKGQSLSISAPVRKAILATFSERDETAAICMGEDGNPEPDPELRDTENVPLKEDIHHYFEREVKPHVPDAWIDEDKTKLGYEIPLTRHFYRYSPPRALKTIEKEIRELEGEIMRMLATVGR